MSKNGIGANVDVEYAEGRIRIKVTGDESQDSHLEILMEVGDQAALALMWVLLSTGGQSLVREALLTLVNKFGRGDVVDESE